MSRLFDDADDFSDEVPAPAGFASDDFSDPGPAEAAMPAAPSPQPATPRVGTDRATASRAVASSTPVPTNPDIDNGVMFGNEPDFDFTGSRSLGAAFDIPSRDTVLRGARRPSDTRKSRTRTTDDDGGLDDILADGGTPTDDSGDEGRSSRDERIAKNKAKREEKKAAKDAAREQRRQAREESTPAHAATDDDSPDGSRHRYALVLGGAAAAVAVGLGAAAFAITSGGDGNESVAAPPSPPATSSLESTGAAAPPAVPNADCPTATTGKVTTGRDAGDRASGAGVIKAFDYAYYVERDGSAARELALRNTRMGSADDMQKSIDKLDRSTKHCLKLIDEGSDVYHVELSEIPPGGGGPTIIIQRIQTKKIDGKYWITSVESLS